MVRVLATLAEDLGSVSGTHMVAQTLRISISGDLMPTSGLLRHQAYTWYTYSMEVNKSFLKIYSERYT